MQHGNWNRDDAFTVMQDFLSKYPKIDAVWASDDDMAVGVLEAIAQAGRENEMWIIGGAGMKEMVKRIMDKRPTAPGQRDLPAGADFRSDRDDGAPLRVRHAGLWPVRHRLDPDDAGKRGTLLLPRQPVLI